MTRLHAEREPLASPLQRSKEILRALEGARPREDVAVNIRKQEKASRRRPRTPPQGGIDGGSRQVIRHAFPEDEAARRIAVAGGGHGGGQLIALEVDGDESDVPWQGGEPVFQYPLLCRLGVRMVDLEDVDASEGRHSVSP